MKRIVKSSTPFSEGWYFGREEFDEYGQNVYNKLKGRSISKKVSLADEVGGLRYEANILGMDIYDLLGTLEGLCHNNMAEEIDDSTYVVGRPDERVILNV